MSEFIQEEKEEEKELFERCVLEKDRPSTSWVGSFDRPEIQHDDLDKILRLTSRIASNPKQKQESDNDAIWKAIRDLKDEVKEIKEHLLWTQKLGKREIKDIKDELALIGYKAREALDSETQTESVFSTIEHGRIIIHVVALGEQYASVSRATTRATMKLREEFPEKRIQFIVYDKRGFDISELGEVFQEIG